VLVRNENYWGTPATIERIIFRNIPEAATQKLQLEAGDIDIAFDLAADQVPSLADNPDVTISGTERYARLPQGQLQPGSGRAVQRPEGHGSSALRAGL